jgi:ferritin-like protein
MGSSTCGFSPPPDDPHDLNRIIELVLKGERCAIEKYNDLTKNITLKTSLVMKYLRISQRRGK